MVKGSRLIMVVVISVISFFLIPPACHANEANSIVTLSVVVDTSEWTSNAELKKYLDLYQKIVRLYNADTDNASTHIDEATNLGEFFTVIKQSSWNQYEEGIVLEAMDTILTDPVAKKQIQNLTTNDLQRKITRSSIWKWPFSKMTKQWKLYLGAMGFYSLPLLAIMLMRISFPHTTFALIRENQDSFSSYFKGYFVLILWPWLSSITQNMCIAASDRMPSCVRNSRLLKRWTGDENESDFINRLANRTAIPEFATLYRWWVGQVKRKHSL